jgi:DNA-binding transcriptional ArsR family regulator
VDSNTDHRLTGSEIFKLLAAPQRRAILRRLVERGGEGTFGDRTNEIATDEHGTDGPQSGFLSRVLRAKSRERSSDSATEWRR